MEPFIVCAATAALILFLFILQVFFWQRSLDDNFESLSDDVRMRFTSSISEDIIEALAHLSRKIDEIKNVSLPVVNEKPDDYLKRMGWDKEFVIRKKPIDRKYWKTKSKDKTTGAKK